jgi:hypothetical protein
MKITGTVVIQALHGEDTQKPLWPFNKHFIGMSMGHLTKKAVLQQGGEDPIDAVEQPSDGATTPQPLS